MKTTIHSILVILLIQGTTLSGGEVPESPQNGSTDGQELLTKPEGPSDSDWAGIRNAYESNRHAITADANGMYQARNPGQAWTTRFDGRGFTISPDSRNWEWGLELQGFGDVTKISNEIGKLYYVRDGGLTEWFINDRRGLEQGWTFSKRPQNLAQGSPLQLLLAVRGGLRPKVAASGASTLFLNPSGKEALTYSGLKAWDANGKKLQVRFVDRNEDGNSIVVEVADESAVYPLTIDPVAQQAYLKASNADDGDEFGHSVAISGDTIVIGAYREDSSATGVNGDETSDSSPSAGAAYVFVRDGTTWTQEAYLKASNTGEGDNFGFSVAIAGDTIVIGARYEDSSATGVNGDESDDSAPYSGAAYVFVRDGTRWSQEAYLKASHIGVSDNFGSSVAVSGDTIVVGAIGEDSSATGVNGDETDDSSSGSGAAYVFVRNGTRWSQEAFLKASNTDRFDNFGFSVSISGDTIVVGSIDEQSSATGVNGDESDDSAPYSGAAYVFARNGASWNQEAYLKASNTDAGDEFGRSVAMSGDTIVVGAFGERSSATGVNGDETDDSSPSAGAAYVFGHDGTNWSQEAYLKASNTEAGDRFGNSVAVSGNTIAVAASGPGAYSFVHDGTSWNQKAHLTPTRDLYGWIAVSVSGDTIVGAGPAAYVFQIPKTFSLLSSATSGSIEGEGEFLPGETVTLTATPDLGFIFDGWTGDVAGDDNPLVLVMDSDKTVGASFVQNNSDADDDGLSAYEELLIYKTDPGRADTDGDGLTDGYEVGIGRFSLISEFSTWSQAKVSAEEAGGHLATFSNQEEWEMSLRSLQPNALNAITGAWIGASDADEEGIWTWITGEPFSFSNWADQQPDNSNNSDVGEVSGGFGASLGKWFDTGNGVAREGYLFEVGYPTDPTIADLDGDGLNDGQENTAGSNPFLSDTDGDGLSDGQEVQQTLTNPTLSDSDGNGIPDNIEDRDNDGLPDAVEIIVHGTDPTLPDTDGDGFNDLFEINTGFDPASGTSTPEANSEILTAIEFRFNAADGVSYRIESSIDLKNWDIVEEGITGTGLRITRFYTIESLPKRHFRARRE